MHSNRYSTDYKVGQDNQCQYFCPVLFGADSVTCWEYQKLVDKRRNRNLAYYLGFQCCLRLVWALGSCFGVLLSRLPIIRNGTAHP